MQIARELKHTCGLNPLVVEFNRSNPALAGMFGLNPARSVAAVAAGTIKAEECVQQGPGGLALLPMGDFATLNSTGQKLQAVAEKVRQELESRYDVMLWDAPPLLEQADAFALAGSVPRIVLVVEAGRSRYEVLDHVKTELAQANIELLGSVLVKQKRLIPGWLYRLLVQ